MQRRVFIAGLLTAMTLAGGAQAKGYQEDLLAQLRAQGFQQIKIETTWLGRLRITASKNDMSREIVLNPRTGEILRDLVQRGDRMISPRLGESGGEGSGGSGSSGSGSSGSGSSGSGSSGSGSGSGSSGSGSSGSGSGDHGDDDDGGDDHSGSNDSGDDHEDGSDHD